MIALVLLVSIFFHTNVQLTEWVEDWAERADYALSAELMDELADMKERHPWYFDPTANRTEIRTSPSTPSGWSGSVEQWRPLVATYFAASKVDTAMCILAHETGFTGDPNSKNTRSSAAGLFQFLKYTWDEMVPLSVTGGSYGSGMVYNPEANVRSAAWLQEAYNWHQWSPYHAGKCRGL